MRGREKRTAGEHGAAREQRRPTRAGRASLHGRARWARVTLRVLRVLCALVFVSVVATAAAFAYLYSHYSKIVDGRLASGYLTSRAGIYAAPRVLRAGQRLTPYALAEILRRAGYVEGDASRVWSGRFKVEGETVEIQSAGVSDIAAAQDFKVVRVEFDRRGQISSVNGDGARLDSYTLEPEPLAVDAGEKTGERSALAYRDIPEVLRRAILSTEDRRFFEHGAIDLRAIARAAFSWGEDEHDF